VRLNLVRTVVGRLMFEKTLAVAKLPSIHVTIAKANTTGLAYYYAMVFIEYRKREGAISKRLKVPMV
jgi:hypothetical protein